MCTEQCLYILFDIIFNNFLIDECDLKIKTPTNGRSHEARYVFLNITYAQIDKTRTPASHRRYFSVLDLWGGIMLVKFVYSEYTALALFPRFLFVTSNSDYRTALYIQCENDRFDENDSTDYTGRRSL